MMVLPGLLAFFLLGCATNIRKPAGPPQPATKNFSTFETVEMAHVTIEPPFDKSGANKKAAKKIDENLFVSMRNVFPGLIETSTTSSTSGSPGETLLIIPVIEEIKFIGGAARFWVGAMAGSSAVLMQVTYKDKATGDILADPEFYDSAGAYSGRWSYGATDNLMLDKIVQQIVTYTTANR